jgi:hypothetical protein
MTTDATPRSAVPTVAIALAAVTVIGSVMLQMLTLPLGVACLVLGILARRRTRGAPPRDRTLGDLALAGGVIAFVVALVWFGIGAMFVVGSLGR